MEASEHSFRAWKQFMETVPIASRARKFVWLRSQGVPEPWMQALEKMFPSPTKERPLASLSQQAVNLGGAIVRNVVSVAKGNPATVTAEEQGRRKTICEACPSSWYRPSDQRCAHVKCNCFVKVKTWAHAERCPAGHW